MEVVIAGKRVRVDSQKIIGEGGEAVVYDISDVCKKTVLKYFRTPDDPFYQQGDPQQVKRNRDSALARISLHQKKLLEFPVNLPPTVIAPQELARKRNGQIVGYTMPFLGGAQSLRKYSIVNFRRQGGIENSTIAELFLELFDTVESVHGAKVVIGDFNSMNVLVDGTHPYLIDADSMQYGSYPCVTFTNRYVDPLICAQTGKSLVQSAAHSETTDWYAYALMLFECLTFVHPYQGGVHRPKKGKRLAPDARTLGRFSVLHDEIIYPRVGVSLDYLPDDLLHFYVELLHKDKRGVFPRLLLEDLRWCVCIQCGTGHARAQCPHCAQPSHIAARKEIVKGKVRASRQFFTSGRILEAQVQGKRLRFVYHQNGEFKREDGSRVLEGDSNPTMRYRLLGNRTVVGVPGQLAIIGGGSTDRKAVDNYRGQFPVFDTNGSHVYWLSGGRLLRDDSLGDKHIGNVLQGQTLFWIGEAFGFGFYQAGALNQAFVFDAKASGLNDSVQLPAFAGELTDAVCYFDASRAWFFAETSENGTLVHYCYVIDRKGNVLATEKATEGSDTWLDSIHSKCAVALPDGKGGSVHALFSADEEGVIRIQEDRGQLREVATFPDTDGIVIPGERILSAPTGLFTVDSRKVELVEIQSGS